MALDGDQILEQLKTYLRIDGAEDDLILGLMIDDAKGYLAGAGVYEIDLNQPLADRTRAERYMRSYQLAIMQHVAMNYEQREAATGRAERWALGFGSRILQLQLESAKLAELRTSIGMGMVWR